MTKTTYKKNPPFNLVCGSEGYSPGWWREGMMAGKAENSYLEPQEDS